MSKIEGDVGQRIGAAASGIDVPSSADAALNQSAFDQNITQGANIQFNSITMQAAGDNLDDDHARYTLVQRSTPRGIQPRGSSLSNHFISVAAVADKKLDGAVRPDGSRRQGRFPWRQRASSKSFRTSQDICRSSTTSPATASQYDETLAPGRSDDYTTLRPNYDHPFSA